MTKKITVQGSAITIIERDDEEYICLTEMTQNFGDGSLIEQWLRNKNTIEFLGIWETLNNPDFNSLEFGGIRNEAGLNRFSMSVKQWISLTHAIGLVAKAGRYGGTYAHKDIAFEFGSWLSPEFKLYLIKEFQRLKNEEAQRLASGWDVKRTLSKLNYKLHTDAVKRHLVPERLSGLHQSLIYASEADVLNKAVFGMTAKEWRAKNPNLEGNMRDQAEVEQLVVMSNLESINAMLIDQGMPQPERLIQLNELAITQLEALSKTKTLGKLKKMKVEPEASTERFNRAMKSALPPVPEPKEKEE